MSKVDWSNAPEGAIKDGDAIMVSLINSWQELCAVLSAFERAGFSDIVEHGFGTKVIDAKTGYLTASVDTVYFVRCESGESKSARRFLTYEQLTGAAKENPKQEKPSADCVKSPNHYQLMDGIESIEIIARSMTREQWKGFCLGNMLKYRIRAGKKGDLQQDIDKANFYGELYEMHKGKCYV